MGASFLEFIPVFPESFSRRNVKLVPEFFLVNFPFLKRVPWTFRQTQEQALAGGSGTGNSGEPEGGR